MYLIMNNDSYLLAIFISIVGSIIYVIGMFAWAGLYIIAMIVYAFCVLSPHYKKSYYAIERSQSTFRSPVRFWHGFTMFYGTFTLVSGAVAWLIYYLELDLDPITDIMFVHMMMFMSIPVMMGIYWILIIVAIVRHK